MEFVHEVSSINISGDAWKWWYGAAGHYGRGRNPERSAVLVFDRSLRMSHGHVAIVSRLIDSRTIEIDHANWFIGRFGRGMIARHVRVVDASDNNDWSSVRVWNAIDHCFGRPYRALGFIYAR